MPLQPLLCALGLVDARPIHINEQKVRLGVAGKNLPVEVAKGELASPKVAIGDSPSERELAYGEDWMPCGESYANAVYFRLGVIAYNLFVAMKVLSLPGPWQRYTIGTVRWRLYETAGRVLWESRRVILKLATGLEKVKLLLAAKRKVQSLATT